MIHEQDDSYLELVTTVPYNQLAMVGLHCMMNPQRHNDKIANVCLSATGAIFMHVSRLDLSDNF